MSLETISKIERRNYTGKVYNLEVEPNDSTEDDQYYVNADNGLVVHNCHPRDNIALRWFAKEYNLGYDLFGAIMESREIQARNMARYLTELSWGELSNPAQNPRPIIIVGKAFKPYVEYTSGSSSVLVGSYLQDKTTNFYYWDDLTGDRPPEDVLQAPAVFLLAHCPDITYGNQLGFVKDWYEGMQRNTAAADKAMIVAGNAGNIIFPSGSTVVDPWRRLPDISGVEVIHYGNTRDRPTRP